MQSKKYQCYNINVQTLVVYATIETKFQTGKNLPKTIWQKPAKNPPKIHGKNPIKIPHAKIQQKSFVKTLT